MKLSRDTATHREHWASSPFFGHHNSQELVFQPLRCGHEVGQSQPHTESTGLAISPFFGHHYSQELVFQALRCDHEVEQRHFGGEFRQVVGVAQLGGDVEAEVLGVLNHVVAQTNHVHTSCASQKQRQCQDKCIPVILCLHIDIWLNSVTAAIKNVSWERGWGLEKGGQRKKEAVMKIHKQNRHR